MKIGKWLWILTLPALCCLVASCGSGSDGPVLANHSDEERAKGEALFQKAKEADDRGRNRRALGLYRKVADQYPFAASAEQARFRQAELLQQAGDIYDAFQAYDQFLTRYPGSSRYGEVVKKQAEMAQSAAEGDVRSGFLGLRSRLSLSRTTEMLQKVTAQAPHTEIASKARFTIGELYESKKNKNEEAIATYRSLVREQPASSQAPEALFRTGILLTKEAERGNQNQANLDLAKEAFHDYLIQYPDHYRNGEAREMIKALSGKELGRSFQVAEFYYKTEKYEAAKMYYREIVKTGGSSDLVDKSRRRLKELGE